MFKYRRGGRSVWRARWCWLNVALCSFTFIRFKADLQDTVTQRVTVQRLDGHHGFVVVGHRDEAEAFAFVGLQVADHFHALDGSERAKQLPENVLLRLWSEVIHENAPAGTVHGVSGQHGVGQQVSGQRRVPANTTSVVRRLRRTNPDNNLNRPVGWWMGPAKRRVAWGVR